MYSSQAYLEPSQTSMTECCKNNWEKAPCLIGF